jgi:DNA processing protein
MSYVIKKLDSKDWPPLIQEINQKPKELFYAGSIPNWQNKMLCIVGARKNSDYGREVTESLILSLRGYPITIVSGLAFGIDSIAHKSAIKAGLKTIAVPGSGLDKEVLYPRSHLNLAEEIIEQGGTLLSEFEPSFRATNWSFPQRNRIMAGISDAVLVVEAEQKSGTLITSRLAVEYNRDVLTIPGNIFSPQSEGPHMLLRLGATPIRNSDDILEALHLESHSDPQNVATADKYFDCSEKEMLIIGFLNEPKEKDEILRQMKEIHNMEVSETQTILTLLELKGLIDEKMGEIYLK